MLQPGPHPLVHLASATQLQPLLNPETTSASLFAFVVCVNEYKIKATKLVDISL